MIYEGKQLEEINCVIDGGKARKIAKIVHYVNAKDLLHGLTSKVPK